MKPATTIVSVVLSVMLIVASLVFMVDFSSGSSGPTASSLQTVTSKTDTSKRVDYVDADGKVTVASDRGYATVVTDFDESGRNVLESYYDADGNPAKASAGQYAVRRAWSGKQNTEIAYLDESGQLTCITSGYAVILRAYNDAGQVAQERYLDADRQPVCCTAGYAARTCQYNDAGKLAVELYLDLDGDPAANTRGAYGTVYEYDDGGHITRLTSLDAQGQPALNASGYCFAERTYNAEGSLEAETYYDVQGNPARLSEGQYGVRYVDGKTVKIDQNGNAIYSPVEMFSSMPWLVVVIAVLLVVLMAVLPQKARVVVLALYVVFILWMTLLARQTGVARTPMAPFATYARFFAVYSTRVEILDNVWLFVPFGAGLYALLRARAATEDVRAGQGSDAVALRSVRRRVVAVVLAACAMSVVIEVLQLAFGLGQCEADDVIDNTLGAAIGMMMAASVFALRAASRRFKLKRVSAA